MCNVNYQIYNGGNYGKTILLTMFRGTSSSVFENLLMQFLAPVLAYLPYIYMR